MFNSTILDVAIGMIFVYLLLSLMCSAANELIELLLKKRARELEKGITELLTKQGTPTGVVAALYSHPLINGLFKGAYEAGSRRLPAYIPATNFALALLDLVPKQLTSPPVVAPGAGALSSPPTDMDNPLRDLRNAVAGISGDYERVKDALLPLIDAAGNDIGKARKNIEDWYNSAMDRVSGWYKRRAQVIIFFLGLFVAVAINVDSVTVAKRLSTDKSMRDSLVAAADEYAKANANASPTPTPSPAPSPSPAASSSPTPCWEEACKSDKDSPQCKLKKNQCELKALNLPIGWDSPNEIYLQSPAWNQWGGHGGWWDQIYHHAIGWLLTALAISLGAPFWFDMLNKLIVVRSTVKPKEKSPDEPSKG
jgi:hypothetical protein